MHENVNCLCLLRSLVQKKAPYHTVGKVQQAGLGMGKKTEETDIQTCFVKLLRQSNISPYHISSLSH